MNLSQAPAQTGTSAARRCPECSAPFTRHHPSQLFCVPNCRDTWNNRAAKRGRVLLPFAQVARATRDGTRGSSRDRDLGKRAAADAHRLLQKWRDEDHLAGSMAAPDFLDLRYKAGFEPA